MLVRAAFVAAVAAAAVIATSGAGGSPAPALTLVAVGHSGSSGAVPPTDAGQGAAHVGVRGDRNAAESAAVERARRDADRQATGTTPGQVGARADKDADRQAAAERAQRPAATRANVRRAEQEAIEKAARRADPSLVGAVARAG